MCGGGGGGTSVVVAQLLTCLLRQRLPPLRYTACSWKTTKRPPRDPKLDEYELSSSLHCGGDAIRCPFPLLALCGSSRAVPSTALQRGAERAPLAPTPHPPPPHPQPRVSGSSSSRRVCTRPRHWGGGDGGAFWPPVLYTVAVTTEDIASSA